MAEGFKIAEAYLAIKGLADTKSITDAVDQGSKAAKGHSSAAGMLLGGAMVTGAGVALGGLALVIKTGWDKSQEAAVGQAQLQAGIKSTGGAAGVSVKQLESLADSIQGYSGQTSDSIVKSEQLLLTFTSIKNATGANNDIFNQATKASADMAAKMGGDASGSAILLGKALNDPTKGLTALTRVGVSFTAAQKAQITAMQKSGNLMGAQKIILHELNTEFGGSAKAAGDTLPGAINKLKAGFADMSAKLISGAMPTITKVVDFLVDKGLPGFEKFAHLLMGDVKVGIADLRAEWIRLQPTIEKGVTFWETHLQPIFLKVANFVHDHLKPILIALGVGIALLMAPIVTVVAGLALLYAKFPLVRQVVADVVEGFKVFVGYIQDTVVPAVLALWVKIQPVIEAIVALFKAGFTAVQVLVETVVKVISDLWDRFGQQLIDHIMTALDIVWQTVQKVFNDILGFLQGIFDAIKGVFDLFVAIFTGNWSGAWNAIKEIFGGVWQAISAALQAVWDVISGMVRLAINEVSTIIGAGMAVISAAWDLAWHSLETVAKTVWDGIKTAASVAWGLLKDIIVKPVTDTITDIQNLFNGMVTFVGKIPGQLESFFKNVWSNIAGDLRGAINDILGLPLVLPTIRIGAFGHYVTVGGETLLPRLAGGGAISGAGGSQSDSIMAMLSDGEYVQNASAVDYYGSKFMEAINGRRIPREAMYAAVNLPELLGSAGFYGTTQYGGHLPGYAAGGPVKYVVSDTVDEGLLTGLGIPMSQIFWSGHQPNPGYSAPTGLSVYAGADGVYVGQAGNVAPSGATILQGASRADTANLISQYIASAAAQAASGGLDATGTGTGSDTDTLLQQILDALHGTGASGGGSGPASVGTEYQIGTINVTMNTEDLSQINTVLDLFNQLTQQARALTTTGS